MKRKGNLFQQIVSLENLRAADVKAQKGKAEQFGVIAHNKCREQNILALNEMLKSGNYKTSPYTTFTIYEPKEREIFRLPYFPDRIMHHAVMNVFGAGFYGLFYCQYLQLHKRQGYSCSCASSS